ncbi:cyclic nucleotide-binding domain-containing protein [Nanoarchaeota archaeon]
MALQDYLIRQKKQRLSDSLRKIALFRNLSRWQVRKLIKSSYIRHYHDKELLFRKGEPSYGLFIVLRGEVEIKDNDKLLTTYAPLDSFGEFALIRDSKRTTDAITKGNTTLCYFFKESLFKLFNDDPRLCSTVYQNLLRIVTETFAKRK